MKCSVSGPDPGSGRVAGLGRRAVGTSEQRRWHPVIPASPQDILSEGGCKSSGGEDPPPPRAVTGLFCICSVRKSEGVLLWLYRRAKSRGCFMAGGCRCGEASVPDAAYSKPGSAVQRCCMAERPRAPLCKRAGVIFLLRAGGSGEEI